MGVLTSGIKKEADKESFSPRSSFLELIEYNPQERTMDITFRSGNKMRYLMVYPTTFQTFKQSPVHSAFYARAIKGNLMSVKIIQNNIGKKSTVLKKEPLNAGLRKQERERVRGSVERALNAAAVSA